MLRHPSARSSDDSTHALLRVGLRVGPRSNGPPHRLSPGQTTIPPLKLPMIESAVTMNGPEVLLPRAKMKNVTTGPPGYPPLAVYVPADSMENVITKYPTLPSNSSVSLALGVYNTTPDSSGAVTKKRKAGTVWVCAEYPFVEYALVFLEQGVSALLQFNILGTGQDHTQVWFGRGYLEHHKYCHSGGSQQHSQ